jgi:hypothetical protein
MPNMKVLTYVCAIIIIFSICFIAELRLDAARSVSNHFDAQSMIALRNNTNPPRGRRKAIPLAELTKSSTSSACPIGTIRMSDTHLQGDDHRQIPKIVHVSSKSRCLPPDFALFLEQWRLPGYSFYFHDDEAVDLLLSNNWLSQFPLLNDVLSCLTSVTVKVDIWRYLVLWEYGGIYTDIDNGVGSFTNESISGTDDAYFELAWEGHAELSQYFMALAPKHPLMHLSIMSALVSILELKDYGRNFAPHTTGPHALSQGYVKFMNGKIDHSSETKGVTVGQKFVGWDARSVKVNEKIIVRNELGGTKKAEVYKAMNMTHFTKEKETKGKSCLRHLYDERGWE